MLFCSSCISLIFLFFSFSSFCLEMRSWQEVVFLKTLCLCSNLLTYNNLLVLLKDCTLSCRNKKRTLNFPMCLCYASMKSSLHATLTFIHWHDPCSIKKKINNNKKFVSKSSYNVHKLRLEIKLRLKSLKNHCQ